MSQFNAQDALLQSLMQEPAAYWPVAETICADDFDGMARQLFVAIVAAIRESRPSDAVTIADELGDKLGAEAMDIACSGSGHHSNIESYARIVAQRGEARRVKQAGQRIALAGSYSDAQAILAEVRPQQAARMKSAKDGLGEMVEALQRRYDADGEVSGVPTSIASLDALTAGWQPGNLVIVAARPGMGKTAFALQAAMMAGRTLFFSLEMTAGELMERAVANAGHLPHRWLRFPKDAPDTALGLITEASRSVSALPLLIDDSAGLTGDAICSRARQAHMADPLKLIIVDHLGLVSRDGKHDPSELGAITSQLKRLAKETNAAVMLLCQLNRGLESRPDKRPQLSDLRDSGRIEEDADVVLALYRDEYYTPGGPLAGYLEIIIRKNRSGEQGTAWATSNLACMRLESTDEPERSAGNAGGNGGHGHGQTRFTKSRQSGALSVVGGDR